MKEQLAIIGTIALIPTMILGLFMPLAVDVLIGMMLIVFAFNVHSFFKS